MKSNDSPDSDALVSRQIAAQRFLLGVSTTTLWRLERAGKLPPHRIGGRVFYKVGDLRALASGH
jgi:hypothetical protein